MEDILASIRKIISDDEPVAMDSPEDIPMVDLVETSDGAGLDDLMQGIHMNSNDLTSDAVLDASVADTASFAAEGGSVDLNIDDVLAGLDEDVLETDSLSADSFQSALDVAQSDDFIPETDDDDILAFLDADIPLVSEPAAMFADAVPVEAAAVLPALVAAKMAAPQREEMTADDDVEMDSLLDDILMSPYETEAENSVEIEPIEADFTAELPETEEMSDLDLVKSLMADLADDPGGLEADEDLEALLAIPEVEGEADVDELMSAFADEPEGVVTLKPEPEEDILGDILDMTLEDELQGHPDDIEQMDAQAEDFTDLSEILEAEQDNIAENALPIADLSVEDLPIEEDFLAEELQADELQDDDVPSLSDIAASAEADAIAVETAMPSQAVAATAGLAAVLGGAALGATAHSATELDDTPAEAEIETEAETTEIYAEPTQESNPNQEPSMPVHAVNSDAILDEVTETAAAGAFAQLNTVVEDKAVFNERGPRIGDLVQDALRPMLKEWLDANLKGIVERAVTKEVKRISSGK